MENKSYEVIINGVGKNITREEDKDAIEKIFNNYKTDSLILRTVGQICKFQDNFYIANYQRGYRWGKDEVEALLNDIHEEYKKDDNEQKYCLQPLVVKKKERVKYTYALKNLIEKTKNIENEDEFLDSSYELLDGQQRLTTLWLILSELKEVAQDKRNYHIYYELLRPVDKAFIDKAIRTISEWLSEKEKQDSKFNKIAFWQTICERLTFVWYEVADKRDLKENVVDNGSEELFRKINKGKIELTNAELFKAMLLNDENAITAEDRRELEQISFEWDKIEQSLRNDEFWFFISNNKSEERTRIDYILEVYARSLEDAEKEDAEKYDILKDRYSFLVVQEKLKKEANGFDGIRKVWRDIIHVHDKLYSWYQDNELYHNIGFLVASEGKRRATATDVVVKLYQNGKDKGIHEVKAIVCGEIFDRLIVKKWKKRKAKNVKWDIEEEFELENLTFDGDKNYLANELLLYSNIFPLLEQGRGKFPFKAYYSDSWDIEHINPQTKESEIKKLITWGKSENNGKADIGKDEIYSNLNWVRNVELILEYLKKKNNKLLPELKEEDRNKDFCEFSSSESGKDFLEEMEKAWDECQVESDVDAVNNFVLLNSKINRGYHNALFNQKRAKIIEYDKNGFFIPMATKNVFLKYYNENPTEFIEWGKEDREGYLNYLEELFNKVKSWEKYSQKGGKSINE